MSYGLRLLIVFGIVVLGSSTLVSVFTLIGTTVSVLTVGTRLTGDFKSDVLPIILMLVIIGIGSFGTVKLAILLRKQEKMVFKLIENEMDDPHDSEFEVDQADNLIMRDQVEMIKGIRSWGLWSLGLGILHLITSGFLDAPWGLMLLVVGASSFYFKTAAMFVIYAVTLTWAGISNLSSFEGGWVFFSLIQFHFAYRVYKQYQRFSATEREFVGLTLDGRTNSSKASDRAARFFPWTGLLLGCSSILGLVLVFIGAIGFVFVTEGTSNLPEYFGFIEGLVVNFAVLGFSVGLASLLSEFRPKALGIVAIAAGALTMVIELVLIFV